MPASGLFTLSYEIKIALIRAIKIVCLINLIRNLLFIFLNSKINWSIGNIKMIVDKT